MDSPEVNFILGDKVSPRKSNLSSVQIKYFLQLLYNNSTKRTMHKCIFLWVILSYHLYHIQEFFKLTSFSEC